MTGTYIPLAQFAQQLASAGSGTQISTWTSAIAAGGTPRNLATAFADAPFIEWFGPCGLGGDDTAVFTKAVASGLPFRLGPKTYVINGSWSSGAVPFLLIAGYPGVSRLVRMEGGTSGAWMGFGSPVVNIKGVIFDANGSAVRADTWSVLVEASVTLAQFENCAFRNNSGSLGRGLAIVGSGASNAVSAYLIDGCEFSGNSSDGCGIFEASDVIISRSRSFGNGGSGIGISTTGLASSSNISQKILIQGNQLWGNTLDGINISTINPSGASPPVYSLATPSFVMGSVCDNMISDNGSYGIQSYGDYLNISRNHISQLSVAAGGIVMTARHSRLSHNVLNVPGAYIGIDVGGCYDCDIHDNSVNGSGVGINPGGSQFVTVTGNKIIGCSVGMSIYDVETDGNGVPFPSSVMGLTIERNTFVVGSGGTAVAIYDGGSGISVTDNKIFGTDSNVFPDQAFTLHTSGVLLSGNLWNGSDRVDLVTNSSNQLIVPDVFDTARVLTPGEIIDSVVPTSVVTTAGQVSYMTVTAGGDGYSQATVAITGSGSGAAATALIAGGQIVGFRVTSNGQGYAQSSTSCSITGDGAGAQASVIVGTPLQGNRNIRLLTPMGTLLRRTGEVMTQANATQRDLLLVAETAVDMVETGGQWLVTGFYPAALLQSTESGGVSLMSPAGETLSVEAGAGAVLQFPNLPSSAAGLPSNALWRNGDALSIV